MIFYKNYNFLFQHINRTGGTAIKEAIMAAAGEPDEVLDWMKKRVVKQEGWVIRNFYPHLLELDNA